MDDDHVWTVLKIGDDGKEATEEILYELFDKMNPQKVYGRVTGRYAMQVQLRGNESVVQHYTGSGKNPLVVPLDCLPENLRELVNALLVGFAEHTGLMPNNVLVQLYDAHAAMGEHSDDTHKHEVVDGVVLSYVGGYHRRTFRVRNDDRTWRSVLMTPGTVVLFDGGKRGHDVPRAYKCSKNEAYSCSEHNDQCVFTLAQFACEHPDCKPPAHFCCCKHYRLNITVRRFQEK